MEGLDFMTRDICGVNWSQFLVEEGATSYRIKGKVHSRDMV